MSELEVMEAQPVPMLRGKFAIYETPKGGIHLVLRADDDTEDRHIDVPPYLIKMARGGLNPFAFLKGDKS